ncbi:Hypothetical protein CINCED_3A015879 [Cinara cedri]|uniref:Methyltransferase small domain-containing protein n=1 Tax=Cinara cedri TaxID=506608 RepID=A0A5E4MXZ4_9HEMI|nr:Hypothetical protein CINCED_3A015879 [Cinara cedri]
MNRRRIRFCFSSGNLPTKNDPLLVVELGSGAGLLSAAVAKSLRKDILTSVTDVGVHCIAVDINPAACHATSHTCLLNNVQVDVVCGDLLSWMRHPKSTCVNIKNVSQGNSYGLIDLLLFNPPYVRGPNGECAIVPMVLKSDTIENSTENQLQSKIADAAWLGGGPDGVEVLKKALHQAADFLSERGVFYVLMIDYNYAALVREEINARCEQDVNNFGVINENNSKDYVLLTTFGDGTAKKPLACRRILSRQVPGEKLSVYRVYRPHILDNY